MIPALFPHSFGGHPEGVLGACPFETLHQFQLGMLKYILSSLFNYRTIPVDFQKWLSKRSNPDTPDSSSSDEDKTELTSDDCDASNPKGDDRRRISKSDESDSNSELPSNVAKTAQHLFSDWLKTRPALKGKPKSSRDVFSRTNFEKASRFINSHLVRQSDRGIPGLSYRAGLTALSKMMGQELAGLCLLTIFAMGGMMGAKNSSLEDDFTILLWMCISMNDNLSQDRYTEECLIELSQRIVRFMEVTKLLIGDQREYESAVGLRLAKFHGMLHYCDQIRKFGAPMNYLPRVFFEGQIKEARQ